MSFATGFFMSILSSLIVKYNNKSIMIKLMAGFIGISLFLVILIGLIANYIFSSEIEKSANEATIQAIRQANSAVDNYIRNAENIMDVIAGNRQVLQTLRDSEISESLDGDVAITRRFTTGNYLASLVESFPALRGIALIRNDNTIISNEMYWSFLAPITDEQWYKQIASNPLEIMIEPSPVQRNLAYYSPISADDIISVSMAIPDPATGTILGIIILDLDSRLLDETLMNTSVGKSGFLFLVDQDGETIFAPINPVVYRIRPEWFVGQGINVINRYISGEHYQLIYTNSIYTGWKVVGVFSLRDTLYEVSRFRYLLVITLVFAMLFISLFSILFSRSISKPIRKLRALMKTAEDGNFSVQFDVRYTDDIGQLGNSFNAMISKIHALIQEIYQQQQQKRAADLKTLQAQIKPHFLYNTFDTIHWMAKRHKAKDIEQIIMALTKLYRIGLSKGSEIITVCEEIDHVRNYLVIQNIRYFDILDYEISCEDSLEQLYVQKLILQPVVENAIYHGIKNKSEPGRISVRAFRENEDLVFEIEDNGPGMSQKKVREIMEQLRSDKDMRVSFGLYNVNKRIVLMYGNEYGVTVRSDNRGTVVTIRYPVITSRGGLNGV